MEDLDPRKTRMLEAVLTNNDPDEDEPIRDEKDLRDIWPFDLPVIICQYGFQHSIEHCFVSCFCRFPVI
jgi:hypothetical protein